MGRYSISDIENISGVKAHTIRIWEKRYDLLATKRTDTNIRFYDDDDLKRILNVTLLVKNGVKISKAAKMPDAEITAKVKELSDAASPYELHINNLTHALIDMDEVAFEKIMANLFIKYGVEQAILDIIYPFLNRVGILWQTAAINPAQEHFMSNLIRQKLLIAVDGLIVKDRNTSTRILLFLPEGELHELGLIFANFLIRSKGIHTLYLGQTVPLADLQATVDYYKPHYLFTIITTVPTAADLPGYIDLLQKKFPKQKILLSARELSTVPAKHLKGIVALQNPAETRNFLKSL